MKKKKNTLSLSTVNVILSLESAVMSSHFMESNRKGCQDYSTQEQKLSREGIKLTLIFLKKRKKYRDSYKNKWPCCEKKCYYFSDRVKTFEESQKFCIKLGSHLLKIDDKGEQVISFETVIFPHIFCMQGENHLKFLKTFENQVYVK